MLPALIPTDLFVPLANVCRSCARHVGKLHHGSSPHRRCRPCELTRSRFASCLQRQQHVRRLHATRRMGLKLWVPSSQKALALSESPVFGHNRRHQCSRLRASHVSTLVPPAIEACSTDRTRDAWHSCLQRSTESPAVTQSAGSFHDLFVAKATSGSQVLRPVRGATEDSGPRDEHVSADLSRCRHARSARHLCRPRLVLRGRPAFQHDGRDSLCARDPPAGLRLLPAGATSVWNNALASCSAQRRQGVTVFPPQGPRPPRCPAKD